MNFFEYTESFLFKNSFTIISKDISKPWGGYFLIEEKQSIKFLNFFFNRSKFKKIGSKLKLTPKVLAIKPNKRLSWQYHNRRSEIWSIIKGDILVSKSINDIEENLICLEKGDQIKIDNKIRHRIVGTNNFSLVAEIWIHVDKSNPSDENDIIRLQDDFNRI